MLLVTRILVKTSIDWELLAIWSTAPDGLRDCLDNLGGTIAREPMNLLAAFWRILAPSWSHPDCILTAS